MLFLVLLYSGLCPPLPNERLVAEIKTNTYDDLSMKYIPIDQVSDDAPSEVTFPLWIYDSPNKARILFQLNHHENLCREETKVDKNLHLAGVAFSDDFNHIFYFLSLNSEDLSSHSYVLKVLPVESSAPVEKGIIEVKIDDLSKL